MNEVKCKKCGRHLGKEMVFEGSLEYGPCPTCGTYTTIDREKVGMVDRPKGRGDKLMVRTK